MKNYFELINLKNIFLKKINNLDLHFQQYGGINFDDDIKNYKRYNSNLEIINRYIDVLLTIKYIKYLIYLIKSFKGVSNTIFLSKLKCKISKIHNDNIITIIDIIINFIDYDMNNNSNNNKSNITNKSNNNKSNITNITNKSKINNIYDELNIYRQHNNELLQIIINNEKKIKDFGKYFKLNIDLILLDDEFKQEKINIKNKFIFLLDIIKEIFEFIILFKYEHKTIFNNFVMNIFTNCSHSIFYKNNKKIIEICKQITLINKKNKLHFFH